MSTVEVPLEMLLFGLFAVGVLLGGIFGFVLGRIEGQAPVTLPPVPMWTTETRYGSTDADARRGAD